MKLKPIDDTTVIYARPWGRHYHIDKDCPMLQGGDFERLGYTIIKKADIKKRRLNPDLCAYEGGLARR
jgi:hypothetical protein